MEIGVLSGLIQALKGGIVEIGVLSGLIQALQN